MSAHRQSLNEPFEEDLEQEYNDSPWEISDSEGDGLVVSQSGSSAKPAFAISTLPGNAKKLVVDPSIEINSTARKPTMEMPHIIDEINFAITCLYKLPLRRPAPLDRFADHTLPDMSIYQHFDILYVKDKFPLADASLTMRLGKLVTRRRQLLFSRVGRDKRLTVNDDESRPINDGPGLPSRPEPGDLHTTGLPDMAKATPSVAPQSQASGSRRTGMTKATILRQENVLEDGPSQSFESAVSDYAPSMASSYATKLRVEVPDRPRGTSGEELDDFKCPYCLIICHVQSKDSWK